MKGRNEKSRTDKKLRWREGVDEGEGLVTRAPYTGHTHTHHPHRQCQ